MEISQSEIASFLQCRRKWDLTSQVRRSLARGGPPIANLHIGSLVHAGMEIHMRGCPEDDFWQTWGDAVNAINAPVLDASVNAPRIGDSDLQSELNAMGRTAGKTLQRFFNQFGYANTYGDLMILGVEFPFSIEVPGLHDVHFKGTFDGIAYDKERDRIVIIEHKTFQRKPDLEVERMKTQFVSYSWAARQLFHREAEILYQGLHKKTANGCMRATFTFDEPELNAFSEFLAKVATDMQDAAGRDMLYPHRHWQECGRCGVREICDMMQRGKNPEPLIANAFRKTEPRSTYSKENSNDTDAVDILMKIIRAST